nr:hypothetical protein [Tanacetum cinerariifolium]
MRFSTPCEVDGNEAMDMELNMAYFDNYISEDLLNDLGYVRLDYGEYGRKMVKDIRVGINGYDVEADFVVYDYMNKGEPSIVFGRSFLVTIKSQVDFGLGEMKINITMLMDNKDVDALLENILKNMVDSEIEEQNHTEEDRDIILGNGLPKKMRDPWNFVRPLRVNGATSLGALVNTGASVSVLPNTLYMNLRLGRDEDGNPQYGPDAASFFDIKDEMERALAMEAYFNPFKNIIVFKKLIVFLGLLLVSLKNNDWGSKGYEAYKKIKGDEAWHAEFEVTIPSGKKFTRSSRPKRRRESSQENSRRRHSQDGVRSETKTREKPRDSTQANSTRRKVNRDVIMRDKFIWFRLCGKEHVLTFPEFVVLFGLYSESDVQHRLFETHFSRLMTNDEGFNHEAYWSRIRQPRTGTKKLADIRDVWQDSMLMRNGYMPEHSMPILHHLVDEANFAYPPYEPPNVPPYPGAMPSHGGTLIIPSSRYDVRSSPRGVQDDNDDDMSDQYVRLEDCVESADDMDGDDD